MQRLLLLPLFIGVLVFALAHRREAFDEVVGTTNGMGVWGGMKPKNAKKTRKGAFGAMTKHIRRFPQMVANSKWVVGVEGGSHRLFYAPNPLTKKSVWKNMNGALLESISLSDSYILGNNRDGSIYAADVSSGLETAYSGASFWNIRGQLYQTALLGDNMYGVNGAGNFFQCAGACKDGSWSGFGGAGMSIEADRKANVLKTRGTDNSTYTCPYPCATGAWAVQAPTP
jgi:hypothetical protein